MSLVLKPYGDRLEIPTKTTTISEEPFLKASLGEREIEFCSHVEILADVLLLLARRVCIASEARIERLKFVARQTLSGARRLPQDDRARHACTDQRKGLGMTPALVVALENELGWRDCGEAADDRRKRGVRSGRRTRVHFGVGGGSSSSSGGHDRLTFGLGLGFGLEWGVDSGIWW